jgi:hypothetical protein
MVLATVPVIDSRPLTDIVEEFEIRRGFDPAAGYGGLVFEFFDVGPKYFRSGDDISVLGCDCGKVGCWPLKCRVKAVGNRITWERFCQPHRPDRDYSNLGPYIFDAAEYVQAVSSLQAKLSAAH